MYLLGCAAKKFLVHHPPIRILEVARGFDQLNRCILEISAGDVTKQTYVGRGGPNQRRHW